jgi:hypothetical protein
MVKKAACSKQDVISPKSSALKPNRCSLLLVTEPWTGVVCLSANMRA